MEACGAFGIYLRNMQDVCLHLLCAPNVSCIPTSLPPWTGVCVISNYASRIEEHIQNDYYSITGFRLPLRKIQNPATFP